MTHEPQEEVHNETAGQKNDLMLPASILVAGLLISGSIIYMIGKQGTATPGVTNQNQGGGAGSEQAAAVINTLPATAQKLGDRDVVLGNPQASVTIIEYGDYQCPFCGRFFSDAEQQLRTSYIQTGKAKMVFRSFQFLGPESLAAGEAAECAKDQHKFWPYHDALYVTEIKDGEESNGNLTRALFISLAQGLKMDTVAFASCLDSHKYASVVTAGNQAAQAAGVNSTPTVYVNEEKFLGAQPFETFAAAIDKRLK